MSNSTVERLFENKQIETAKSILESNGYIVSKKMNEVKGDKTYTIVTSRRGKTSETTSTLTELIDKFSYTLQTGKSYERERGNKKIDTNPKTIKSLITNLNNSVNNSASNGYSSTYYYLKESKNLKESSSSSYTLEDLQRLIDLDEETDYELYLSAVPTSDDVPFAWDSTISVEGDRVIIQGGIAPGSDYDRSSVVINTSLRYFQRFYTLGINHTQQSLAELGLSEEDQNFIWSICKSY